MKPGAAGRQGFVALGELRPGDRAEIMEIGEAHELSRSFLQMGLLEGSEVRVVHEAPLGGDPIAVQVRGGLIALRRQEAGWIRVRRLEGGLEGGKGPQS